MNFAKFFFTLTFFFSLSVFTQAQVEVTSLNNNETSITATVNEIIPALSEENKVNTTQPATSNTKKSSIDTNKYVFSFNHKQFLKPVVSKRAYC